MDVDWPAVETEFGLTLPADFKRLMDRFPSGWFCSFFEVYSPEGEDVSGSMFHSELTQRLERIRDWVALDPSPVPYPVHPEPGGIIPWGGSASGNSFFWLPGGRRPDEWTVVFCDDEFSQWGEYPGPASAFLLDVLTGAFVHDFFVGYPQGVQPDFGPME